MRKVTTDLIAGAVGLILVGASPAAHAQSERTKAEEAAAALAEEGPKKDLPTGAEDLPPPSAGELLAERERALDAREAEIEQAEKDLAVAEKKLEARIAKLERLIEKKRRIEQNIRTEAEEEAEARLQRMREVTARMPPENAAAYLTEMPVRTASQILTGIKSRKAAAIMAELPPSKAAEISRKYLKSGKSSRQPNLPKRGEPSRSAAGAAED
jgi:flagellar motility protein MotE (MotC chaperone)